MCLGAIGQLMGANAQADALDQNARLDLRQAGMERDATSFKARQATDDARRLMGRQIAGAAANGFSLSGSPGAVIEDSARSAGLDIAAIRYGGEAKASNLMYSAALQRQQAASLRSSAPIIAGATAITDIANFAVSAGAFGS